MNSLKEVYGAIVEGDQVKMAQARAHEVDPDEELLKQASDYYQVGQILAHNVFADMVKQAMEEEMPNASEDEKKKKLEEVMAKARGEEPKKEEKKDEKEGEKEGEKMASVKLQILEKMAQDPAYVSQLIAKHSSR